MGLGVVVAVVGDSAAVLLTSTNMPFDGVPCVGVPSLVVL